jgi:hypothetical protein
MDLPDTHPVCNCNCQIQLPSRLHIKRRVPRVDIADSSRPELVGGVPVGPHILAESSFTFLRFPVVCESKEELLVAGKAVLNRSGFSCQ